jgi:hypothetical protein
MGITIGPADWWVATPQGYSGLIAGCPAGTILPDGSALICKAGGTAWIVAPFCTEVKPTWSSSANSVVGERCCVCDWSTLCSRLISCGFTPADWFVPSQTQLQNPGSVCRSRWDFCRGSGYCYWSSTEVNGSEACTVRLDDAGASRQIKSVTGPYVRAMRCVTY